MINTGKCPNPECSKMITKVQGEGVDVVVGLTNSWKGFTLLCPHCKTVLGASIDPIAIKNDIIQHINKTLGRR